MGAARLRRAARLHRFGAPLRLDLVPEPVPGDGEVVVETTHIGVNPVDLWLTDGEVAGGLQRLPFVPGTEAAGLVDGRPVLVHGGGVGMTRDGLYTERAAVPRGAVVALPEGTDPALAAAMAVSGSTAWLLVHEVARVGPDDRALVLGASGGVGTLLAQMAVAAGAVVWAQTSHADKLEFVRGFGAHEAVVAAGAASLAEVAADLDPTVVFDPLGDGWTAAAVDLLAPAGRLVLFGTSAGATATLDLRLLYKKGIAIRTYSGRHTPPDRAAAALASALDELAAGRVRPFVDEVLPLDRAAEAHERLRAGQVRGKLLLRP